MNRLITSLLALLLLATSAYAANSFISAAQIATVTNLRHQLHAHPEVGNTEVSTTSTIVSFLQSLTNPPQIISGIGMNKKK